MPGNDIDILAIDHGTVTAPAGCGKTHLIAEGLARHSGEKPVLVLTHTNAGVAALRERLNRAGVPPQNYRLSTIDGWAMRLISTFPAQSGHDQELLKLTNAATDYPNIRKAAARLLKVGHINEILKASYARLIVDEYQDCSTRQHALVTYAAETLPTCVLGDPLQAIFGFGNDALANWHEEVCLHFPLAGELNKPWRWINADAEPLGQWLLEVRGKLLRGESIDLRVSPDAVTWVELDGTKEDHKQRREAALVRPLIKDGCVLIIGESASPNSQHKFASQTPGAVTVEAVDLKDLVLFARDFDIAEPDALKHLIEFAKSVMTNVGNLNLERRIQSLARGTARNSPTEVEKIALNFIGAPSHRAAADLLKEIHKQDRVRPHRPAIFYACIKALRHCSSENATFLDAAIQVREHNRFLGRPLPRRAVGSTLLIKGLEAEVAVILNADPLDARNLYVAMTRGSHALTICSKSPLLNP